MPTVIMLLEFLWKILGITFLFNLLPTCLMIASGILCMYFRLSGCIHRYEAGIIISIEILKFLKNMFQTGSTSTFSNE